MNVGALLGRDDELARVRHAFDGHSPNGCILVGGEGVGKSALARTCLETAEDAGYRCARVLATRSAAEVPLGALATVLPDIGDGPAALARSIQAIRELAGDGRFVLLVDDAHLLDELSAAAILAVADDPSVWCLLTVRTGEHCPDAITALWKDLGAERITIDPLGTDAMRALVAQLLPGTVPDEIVDRFVQLASGRPLALRELVRAEIDGGRLVQDGATWIASGVPTVPPSIAELIEERLGRMGTSTRDLITMLALCEPFPLAAIDHAGFTDSLAQLEEAGLVTLTDVRGSAVVGTRPTDAASRAAASGQRPERPAVDPRARPAVRLDHPLYAEVVLASLTRLQRNRMLLLAADAVDAAASSDRDVVRTVLWRHRAGEPLDAGRLVEAAHHSYRSGDYQRCGELAEAAWRLEPSFDAGLMLGFSLGRDGRCEEADQVLAATEPLAGGERDLVLVTLARSENRYRGLGDHAGSDALCRDAEARLVDPGWRAEVTAHRSMGVVQRGEIDEALGLLEPLLDPSSVGDRAFVKAAYAAGLALCHAGRPEDATAVAVQALPIHEAVWSADLFQTEPGVHHLTNLFALLASGRLNEAEPLFAVARELTQDADPPYAHAWICFVSGLAASRRGAGDDAVAHFDVARPLFVGFRQRSAASWCAAGASIARSMQGRTDAARTAFDEALALHPDRSGLNAALFAEAEAWLAIGAGFDDGARGRLLAAATEAAAKGDRLDAARLLVLLARGGAAAAAHERIASVVEATQGELPELQVALVSVLAGERDAASALELSGRFAQHGMDVEAAELAAVAARRFRRGHQARKAAEATRTGRAVLARTQGVRTPLLADLLVAGQLTARERDVARLAASRLASKEIAAQLGISVRTVDNHLRNVYQKLNVSSRADLAAALGPEEMATTV